MDTPVLLRFRPSWRNTASMSHTVQIHTQFKDLDALRKTLAEFGWNLVERGRIRTYSSSDSSHIYDYVAVNPQQGYDIGVELGENSEIRLLADLYDGSITNQLGVGLAKLKQKYSKNVLEAELLYRGYQVDFEQLANGTIEVTATKLEQTY